MVSFAVWVERAHGGGRRCPDIFRPGLESLNEADGETLMTNVTLKESNQETQRAVWTAVGKSIKEGIAAAHGTGPSDLQLLSFVAWASSPPDYEERDERDEKRDDEKRGGGRKPREISLMPGGDGDDSMWGRALSKDEIKALPRTMRDHVEDQEAPGVASLVVLSVSMMFGGKVAVEECEGALFGESPMGEHCASSKSAVREPTPRVSSKRKTGLRASSAEKHDLRVSSAEEHDLRVSSAEEHDLRVSSAEGHDLRVSSAEEHDLRVSSAEEHDLSVSSAKEHDLSGQFQELV
eukprot:7391548-Prymnesium_polylepis.1